MSLTEEEREAIVKEINRSKADIVWVGIGVPKQEKWMAENRADLDAPVLIGVGAAFDFHAGLVPQAPNWAQEAGLEWAYRLAHEPRRLWRRYLRYNPLFVTAFARQLTSQRQRARTLNYLSGASGEVSGIRPNLRAFARDACDDARSAARRPHLAPATRGSRLAAAARAGTRHRA